jgi:DNA-binding response OmpR family regulator
MDGVEVLRRMKELKGNRAKVLMVSASPSLDRHVDPRIDVGVAGWDDLLSFADGLMSKPHDVEVLLAKIKELIG